MGTQNLSNADTLSANVVKAGKVVIDEWTIDVPDFALKRGYPLPTMKQVETYFIENGHLEGFPSAAELKAKGMNIADFNLLLLLLGEHTTLHLINQDKRIDALEKKLNAK